jgi:phospholipase C
MMVISPWAIPNYVDHTVTDQSSIIHFIEDNWLGGQRIGQGSFDALANSIASMFNFSQTPNPTLLLSETTGEPLSTATASLQSPSRGQRGKPTPGIRTAHIQTGPGL